MKRDTFYSLRRRIYWGNATITTMRRFMETFGYQFGGVNATWNPPEENTLQTAA